MHPELVHLLHQQRQRELEQHLARALTRRESTPSGATRDSSPSAWAHRAAAASVARAAAVRARLGRLRTSTVAVDCCVAA